MPPILGWSRPLGETKYHAIIEIAESAHTSCNGRWSRREPSEFLEGRDRDVDHAGNAIDKCRACDLAAKRERTDECLAELREAVGVSARVDYGLARWYDFRSSITPWWLA